MLAVFAAVHLAVLAPWLYRMSAVGAGVMATELKLGYNLYQNSNPYVEEGRPGDDLHWPAGLEDMTPKDRDSELVHLGVEGIHRHPLWYLRNCARRLSYELTPWPHFTALSKVQAAVVTVSGLLYMYGSWTLLVFAMRRGAWLSSDLVVLLVALGLWYGCHSLIAGSTRMRIPSDPWVPALALGAWSSRTRRGASTGLGGVLPPAPGPARLASSAELPQDGIAREGTVRY
jgi:hypothetical protein